MQCTRCQSHCLSFCAMASRRGRLAPPRSSLSALNPEYQDAGGSLSPDFLWKLLALANLMRLSLLKAAQSNLFRASYRKSGSGRSTIAFTLACPFFDRSIVSQPVAASKHFLKNRVKQFDPWQEVSGLVNMGLAANTLLGLRLWTNQPHSRHLPPNPILPKAHLLSSKPGG